MQAKAAVQRWGARDDSENITYPAGTWCRVKLPGRDSTTTPAVTDDDSPAHPGERRIRCRNCAFTITSSDYSAQIDGNHHHTFFNPAGIIFEIRCFHQAPGGFPKGDPSMEFSWFAGYSWQVVLCRKCGQHMGWRFSGKETYFYGLISTTLQEE